MLPSDIKEQIIETHNNIAVNTYLNLEPIFCKYTTEDPDFDAIFENTHKLLNYHFELLYERFTKKPNGFSIEKHYKAIDSIRLINLVKFVRCLKGFFEANGYSFSINKDYEEALDYIMTFICKSGGSTIPDDFEKIETIKDKCVFVFKPNASNFGNIKNIIFAGGYKADIVINDALENNIEIKNPECCLVYNQPINGETVTLGDLKAWWESLGRTDNLAKRLLSCQKEKKEKDFFNSYYKFFGNDDSVAALIPQVQLHYDPKTIKEQIIINNGKKTFHRQRMDFLILWKGNRIIIEIDGIEHYSDEQGKPCPKNYAEQVADDRKMKFLGYDIYRLGGYELMDSTFENVIKEFFERLRNKYF